VIDAVAGIVKASMRHAIRRKDEWIIVAMVSGESRLVDFL
jgi:hypothetical protein